MFDINIDMHEIEQPQKKRRAPYGSDRSARQPKLRSVAKGLLREGKGNPLSLHGPGQCSCPM
jgi:hypothetical protein